MLVVKKGVGVFEEVKGDQIKKIIDDALGYNLNLYRKNSFEFVAKGSKDFFKKLDVYPNKQFLKNSFTVTVDGESVTYGYCDRLKVKNVMGGFSEQTLDPERNKDLFIKGRTKTIPKDKLDLVAYFLLYPKCSSSPYRKGDSYDLLNATKDATKNLEQMKTVTEWKNRLLNTESIEKISSYLQSIGHRNTHLMEDDELRVVAIENLDKDINKFLKEYNSQDINIRADVQKFIDERYLTYHEFSGRKEWRLNIGDEQGYPIVDVQKEADKFDSLLRELTSNPRLYDKLKGYYLNAKSATVAVNEKKAKVEKTEKTEVKKEEVVNVETESTNINDVVKEMIDNGTLRYFNLTKSVSVYENDKKVPKSAGGDLFTTTEETWVADLYKFASENPDVIMKIGK